MKRVFESVLATLVVAFLQSTALLAASDTLSQIVTKRVPGFRIAEPQDFSTSISGKDGDERNQKESFFCADFDGDGKKDWAAILIHDKSKEHRYCYLLGNGKVELLLEKKGNVIEKPMFFKPASVGGMGERRYSDIVPGYSDTDDVPANLRGALAKRQAHYKSVPAIEVCVSSYDLCGTQQAWFFESGKLQSFTAGD